MIDKLLKKRLKASCVIIVTLFICYSSSVLAEIKESLPRIKRYNFNIEKKITQDGAKKFSSLVRHVQDSSHDRMTKNHSPIAQLHENTAKEVRSYGYDIIPDHKKKSFTSLTDSKDGSVVAGVAYSRTTKKPNLFKAIIKKEQPVNRMHVDLVVADPAHKGAGSQLLSKTIMNEVDQLQKENQGKDGKLTITLDALHNQQLIKFYKNKFGFQELYATPGDDTTRRMGLVLDPNRPEDYQNKINTIKSAH